MADYNERACTFCGSLLHHEDRCPQRPGTLAWLDATKDRDPDENEAELRRYAEKIGIDPDSDLPWWK